MEAGVQFPPKASKSKIFCCVFGCNSKACRNPELSFHHFPKAGKMQINHVNKLGQLEMIDRRKLWERILKMGKEVTQSMRVCSLHFVKDDYSVFTRPDYPAGARFLKGTAVPSVNLPQSSIKTNEPSYKEVKEREIRLAKRVKRIKLNAKKKQNKCNCLFVEEDNTLIAAQPFEEVNVVEKSGDVAQETSLIDVKVQIKSEDLSSTYFFNFLKSDEELSAATGIQNSKLFERIVAAVERAAPQLSKHTGVITIREIVLMTFIKLKQNLSYSFLSILFPAVSNRYCSEIICNMLDILCDVLRPYIYLPSGDEILKNMPLCFNKYTDTRIILDCTEIEIQKPKNLCCQRTTYSNYKRRYTIKFMTGVTPGGIISFVSKPYDGKASNKAIFEQSLLPQQLENGVSIMVDRGFLIHDLCSEYNVKLIRLSFLKEQGEFSADDAVKNADIASAREHVERLNQRLKVFEILGSKMALDLVPKSEKIVTILCALINLSNPIFKDDLLTKPICSTLTSVYFS